ncbi:MAG TPA: SagB/ThcOx family dehydrogenase [Bacteroidales bacterium]|nr:SagB/ThcOx family dehydrogenase [Bacteroidales bacterium]HPT22354.1 SagB/ThcOx family dehydrogenase [Bacteroidales bacterium]
MIITIPLPAPRKELEFPLMKALETRRTKRKWAKASLSDQELADILWAGCGVTMPETKRSKCRRTVPSAHNAQSVSIYVALERGLFRYDEKVHSLIQVSEKDIRNEIGSQKMMKTAPVALIYVSDFSKLKWYTGTDDSRRWFAAGTEVGFISQNVYLYCAAAGLNTAVIGLVDRQRLGEVMELSNNEKVVYTQVIGRPPEE